MHFRRGITPNKLPLHNNCAINDHSIMHYAIYQYLNIWSSVTPKLIPYIPHRLLDFSPTQMCTWGRGSLGIQMEKGHSTAPDMKGLKIIKEI